MPTRTHDCPATGCGRKIPVARFACPPHWRQLPYKLKAAIYATYRAGQENAPHLVSDEYVAAANEARDYLGRSA